MKPILCCAAFLALIAPAWARDRYQTPYAPPVASNYGTVNNYYAPVTIYAAPSAPAYPADYGGAYATAPGFDATSYGVGYDGSAGQGYGGYGYGPAYGYGQDYGYGYGPPYGHGPGYGYGRGGGEGARLDPWHGYNWGPNNGY